MGWKAVWFGSDTPAPGQVTATVAVLGTCALALTGLFVDFVPAPALHGLHVALLFLVGGVIGTALLIGHARRHGRMALLLDQGFLKFLFLLCGMPVMLGLVGWLVLARSLPWAWTCVFGEAFRESHIMQTHYTPSRRACDYRLRGAPMERGFPSYLCIREAFYHRHPEQQVSVVLSGRRSLFGSSIRHIESGN
ncbi:hypothetical protein IB223_10930 [Pseudoxanthomonas sp. PXM03]|uniref:hypothetical protein n=1 Tax=Pseudoxanthomonas sp. PXM03 TaxID=2769284 RepID=UPI0017859876|nr:hypothetical protein [Pseudoxanthomonas sp. PXM03]MBD9436607.1 hypothetical protein [Pseudoxanthomonas sp. PXM03]